MILDATVQKLLFLKTRQFVHASFGREGITKVKDTVYTICTKVNPRSICETSLQFTFSMPLQNERASGEKTISCPKSVTSRIGTYNFQDSEQRVTVSEELKLDHY